MKQGTLPVLKLYDFGLSKDKRDDSSPRTQIGTALFTSPEVFLNMDGQSYEGDPVDVWSCGVVRWGDRRRRGMNGRGRGLWPGGRTGQGGISAPI